MNWKQTISCSVLLVFMSTQTGISQTQEGKLDKADQDKQADSMTLESDSQTIRHFYAGKVLKGTVELSTSLPHVPKELMPGNKYPDDPIVGIERTDHWYRIPDWVAGRWKSTDGEANGKPIQQETGFKKGTLRDAEGSLWELISVPYQYVIKDPSYANYTMRRIVDYSDEFIDSQGRIQTRSHQLQSYVDDRGIILGTFQDEIFAICILKKDGLVEVKHTSKRFDVNGKYIQDNGSLADYSRIQPFPFVPKPDEAVQKSFKNYLKTIGLEKLTPASFQ